MRFAYADPPYYGCAVKFYGDHPDAAVYDTIQGHVDLIDRLVTEFPDGWAYSCTSPFLRTILPFCPEDARVSPWVKLFHVYKKGVRPAYAWEPIIWRGGRNDNHPPPDKGGEATTPKDFVIANITLRKGLTGAKPPEVCRKILDWLNYQHGDEIVDLFPGTGVMGRVAAQGVLSLAATEGLT